MLKLGNSEAGLDYCRAFRVHCRCPANLDDKYAMQAVQIAFLVLSFHLVCVQASFIPKPQAFPSFSELTEQQKRMLEQISKRGFEWRQGELDVSYIVHNVKEQFRYLLPTCGKVLSESCYFWYFLKL